MPVLPIVAFSLWSCFGFYVGNVLIVSPHEHAGVILLKLLFSPIIPLIGLIWYLDLILSEWYFKLFCDRNPLSGSHNKENLEKDVLKPEVMERDEERGLLS